MDADLQDPPEVIPSLVAKWQDGFDVVLRPCGRARDGEDAAFKLWNRCSVLPSACASMTHVDISCRRRRLPAPLATGRSMRSRSCPERAPLPAGNERAGSDFRQVAVPYEREGPIRGGRRTTSRRRMIALALDANHVVLDCADPQSSRRWGSSLVIFLRGGSCVDGVRGSFFTDTAVAGWTSFARRRAPARGHAVRLRSGSSASTSARIFEEAKQRPPLPS